LVVIDSTAASDRRPRLLRTVLPLALMAVIWWLSDQPSVGPDLGDWARLATSAVHFAEFALLYALWWWALRGNALAAAAIALAWAGLDEVHQSWVPGRDADPIDFVVDAAGIAFSWALCRSLARRRRRRRA
jgi:VanZ family protein